MWGVRWVDKKQVSAGGIRQKFLRHAAILHSGNPEAGLAGETTFRGSDFLSEIVPLISLVDFGQASDNEESIGNEQISGQAGAILQEVLVDPDAYEAPFGTEWALDYSDRSIETQPQAGEASAASSSEHRHDEQSSAEQDYNEEADAFRVPGNGAEHEAEEWQAPQIDGNDVVMTDEEVSSEDADQPPLVVASTLPLSINYRLRQRKGLPSLPASLGSVNSFLAVSTDRDFAVFSLPRRTPVLCLESLLSTINARDKHALLRNPSLDWQYDRFFAIEWIPEASCFVIANQMGFIIISNVTSTEPCASDEKTDNGNNSSSVVLQSCELLLPPAHTNTSPLLGFAVRHLPPRLTTDTLGKQKSQWTAEVWAWHIDGSLRVYELRPNLGFATINTTTQEEAT